MSTGGKGVIVDFGRKSSDPTSLLIKGVSMGQPLLVCQHHSNNKKKHSKDSADLERKLLVAFYQAVIESILTYNISVWYASYSAIDKKALQKVVKLAAFLGGYRYLRLHQ